MNLTKNKTKLVITCVLHHILLGKLGQTQSFIIIIILDFLTIFQGGWGTVRRRAMGMLGGC